MVLSVSVEQVPYLSLQVSILLAWGRCDGVVLQHVTEEMLTVYMVLRFAQL